MTGTVPVIAAAHPFRTDHARLSVPEGRTLAEILAEVQPRPELSQGAHVFIGDQLVPRHNWHRVRPHAGVTVTIRAVPMGGGGGKNPLRTVLTIAVIAASMWVAGGAGGLLTSGSMAATGAAAATSVAGMYLVNQIAPPPAPELSRASGAQDSQTYSLTGGRNILNPYGPVPVVLGRHRITPPYGARPYTEIAQGDQYLRLLFAVGYGPLALSEFRIGETLIDDNGTRNFDGLQMQTRAGNSGDATMSLFNDSVYEEQLSVLLEQSGGWVQRTTQLATDEIIVDVTFPQGLVEFDNKGNKQLRQVDLSAEYRAVGDSTWKKISPGLEKAARNIHFTAYWDYYDDNSSGYKYRIDRLVIDRETGEFSIIKGVEAAVPVAPPVPATKLKICQFDPGLTRPVPTDERDSLLTQTDPNAFSPSQASKDWYITIGSGLLETSDLFGVSARTTSALRRSARVEVPNGQYEVRLSRTTADSTSDKVFDKVYWTALRSVADQDPITLGGVAKVAMRVKATDQLNGLLDQFNCIAQTVCLDWDSTSQTWVIRGTSNPASLYRYLLQGPMNPRPVADSRLDLTALQDWHDECRTAGRMFNAVIDYRTTLNELLINVAAVGRASRGMRDGKYSVVRDITQTVPVQHFTPRNSWGFSGEKTFTRQLHGLKVQYVDRAAGYQRAERIVYADGYDETNASEFETLELFGVTAADQAWRDGRYHLAVLQLRPERYTLNVDLEHLVCTRGDLVRVAHDVPMFGIQAARIKQVTTDGNGDATAITVDDLLAMEAGKSYAVRIRHSDGASSVHSLVTEAGEQSTVTFQTPIPAADIPAAGDLTLFGESGAESVELLVSKIEMQGDMAARLTLVDAAPAVHQADQGTIPAFDPQITVPPELRTPDVPVVDGIRSDESVLIRNNDGSLTTRMLILLGRRPGLAAVTPLRVEVQVRPSGIGQYQPAPVSGADTQEVSITDVDDGVTYDVRLRYVTSAGKASPWSVTSHTVIGKTTPPHDVPGLLYEPPYIVWRYQDPPKDLGGFKIRFHAGDRRTWSDATPAHDHIVTENRFDVTDIGGGVRTLLVKAVDIAGNESDTPAILVKDVGDPLIENIILTEDYKAAGWPGQITNGEIVLGDLEALSTSLAWTGNDANPTWSGNDNNPAWSQDYQAMTYQADYVPTADVVGESITLDTAITGVSYAIEYRTDSPLPMWGTDDTANMWDANDGITFWSPFPDWKAWPGKIGGITRQLYQFRATTAAGSQQGKISAFTLSIDVPDIEERFDDITIAAAGTRLPIAQSYRVIKNVSLTLQDNGGTGATVKTVDKDSALGPLIKVFDTSGTGVAGLIDAIIQGY